MTSHKDDYCSSAHYKNNMENGEIYAAEIKATVCRICHKPHITRALYFQFCGCCETWYYGKPDTQSCNDCKQWF